MIEIVDHISANIICHKLGPVKSLAPQSWCHPSYFFYKQTTKGKFENLQNLNEFRKLSTSSADISRTMNNLKKCCSLGPWGCT